MTQRHLWVTGPQNVEDTSSVTFIAKQVYTLATMKGLEQLFEEHTGQKAFELRSVQLGELLIFVPIVIILAITGHWIAAFAVNIAAIIIHRRLESRPAETEGFKRLLKVLPDEFLRLGNLKGYYYAANQLLLSVALMHLQCLEKDGARAEEQRQLFWRTCKKLECIGIKPDTERIWQEAGRIDRWL